jgi:hypothetical protein
LKVSPLLSSCAQKGQERDLSSLTGFFAVTVIEPISILKIIFTKETF